jgi:hypothetical protein
MIVWSLQFFMLKLFSNTYNNTLFDINGYIIMNIFLCWSTIDFFKFFRDKFTILETVNYSPPLYIYTLLYIKYVMGNEIDFLRTAKQNIYTYKT